MMLIIDDNIANGIMVYLSAGETAASFEIINAVAAERTGPADKATRNSSLS
jgi:hypothetical protein